MKSVSRRAAIGLLSAAALPIGWARAAGMEDPRVALRRVIRELVDEGAIPGAVLLVGRGSRLLHHDVAGWQDGAARTPMRRDTIFRLYSMSKPITSVAIMTLVEQGRLGLDLAREHPPSLILLDINLPDVNGLELLTQIRAEKNLSEVPVIILSADATARQIEKAKELGANAYLTKPFILREFIESVTGFLSGGN